MKKLVIVESPNKIDSIKKYLGKGYEVMASVGHIVRLPNSGKYRFGCTPGEWVPDWKIDKKKEDVVKKLRKASTKADQILIATDPDREGEGIAQNLVDFLRIKKKYTRISFNEITEEAVIESLESQREVDHDLVDAQIARRILDRVIGYQLSSLMRKKIKGRPMPPSAGRVQSIALKLVVEKEKEIDAFIPVRYAKIDAIINEEVKASLYYPEKSENKDWVDYKKANDVAKSLTNKLKVTSVETTQRKSPQKTPLKQAALYRRADSSLGMSAASTRRAAQRLYEGYGDGGLISYPRTDSTRISAGFIKKTQAHIKKKFGDEYLEPNYKAGKAGDQDAHEAIRPTSPTLTPDRAKAKYNLEASEYKLYKLIYEHTLSCFIKVPISELIRYELIDGETNFKMTSSKVIFDGYFKLTGYEKANELPKFRKNQNVIVEKYDVTQSETKPPARYNDGSLIQKLDEIKVGRPSTFETTVRILKQRAYVDELGKALKPTDFGKVVYSKLIDGFPDIINETYTASLERELTNIAKGKVEYKKFLTNFWKMFEKEVIDAESELLMTSVIPIPVGKLCPLCNNQLIEKRNKITGQSFFGCSTFPECKHTESDPKAKKIRRFFKKK